MNHTSVGLALARSLALILIIMSGGFAAADPVTIVAVGASNTSGFNAGVGFDTTAGMLRRLDSSVPDGTKLVILQPGGNDRRFFVTREQRAANIAAIEDHLRARGIKVVVFDPVFPSAYYIFDGIHFTAAAHAQIAERLLPEVMAALPKRGRRSEHR